MYIAEVFYRTTKLTTIFTRSRREVQDFALEWSKNKHTRLGFKVPFGELQIKVFDVSVPCAHDHIDVPMIYF
jgi:hypothetical protein